MSDKGWAAAPASNWDEVDTEAPPPLEPGVYGFKIGGAEPHTTKPKPGSDRGSCAVNLELTITHKHGDAPGALARKCFATLMLEGDGRFRTKQLMQAVQIDPPQDNELDTIEGWCTDLCGREGYAQFKQREYTPKGSLEKKIALDVERFLNDETLQIVLAKLAEGSAAESGSTELAPNRRKRGARAA